RRAPRRDARRAPGGDLHDPRQERDGEDHAAQDADGTASRPRWPRGGPRRGRESVGSVPDHAARRELRPPGEIDLPGSLRRRKPQTRATGAVRVHRPARRRGPVVSDLEGAAPPARGNAVGWRAEDAPDRPGVADAATPGPRRRYQRGP